MDCKKMSNTNTRRKIALEFPSMPLLNYNSRFLVDFYVYGSDLIDFCGFSHFLAHICRNISRLLFERNRIRASAISKYIFIDCRHCKLGEFNVFE